MATSGLDRTRARQWVPKVVAEWSPRRGKPEAIPSTYPLCHGSDSEWLQGPHSSCRPVAGPRENSCIGICREVKFWPIIESVTSSAFFIPNAVGALCFV